MNIVEAVLINDENEWLNSMQTLTWAVWCHSSHSSSSRRSFLRTPYELEWKNTKNQSTRGFPQTNLRKKIEISWTVSDSLLSRVTDFRGATGAMTVVNNDPGTWLSSWKVSVVKTSNTEYNNIIIVYIDHMLCISSVTTFFQHVIWYGSRNSTSAEEVLQIPVSLS